MDLRSYLASAQITAEQFADHLNVHVATVYRWFKGDNKPDNDAAVAIERATNGKVPVEEWATAGALSTRPLVVSTPPAPATSDAPVKAAV